MYYFVYKKIEMLLKHIYIKYIIVFKKKIIIIIYYDYNININNSIATKNFNKILDLTLI